MTKTAIVTGGSRGIGAATSSLLAANGYNVIINYNASADAAIALKADIVSKGFNAEVYKCDVSDSDEVNSMLEFCVSTFGFPDLLVNNAGIAGQKLFTDITDSDWSRMLSVDLTGVFNCCRAASKHMIKKHAGSIINISSMWGVGGASCEVHYSAAKAGVIGLTKALAKELGPSGIRVNCIAPGVIDTEMNSKLSAADIAELADATPLCRIGKPSEVAAVVEFLASDKASFITGQTISVDGGFII